MTTAPLRIHGFAGRKGQFYIFFAIILIASLLVIIPRGSTIAKPYTALGNLADNFRTEAPKAVNSALSEGANSTARFSDFATRFHAYAQSKEPTVGMVAVLRDNGLHVENYMGAPITLAGSQVATMTDLPDGDTITVGFNGSSYGLTLPARYSVAALFRAQQGQSVEVERVG